MNYTRQINSKWNQTRLLNPKTMAPVVGDQLEMSASSKLLKECVEKARQLNQSRDEQIQALKERIQSGTYEVSPERISKAMQDEGFLFTK